MAVLKDNRIRDLFRKYGKTAVGVHLTVYAATLTGLYVAVENKFDPVDFLVRHGLLSEKALHVDKKPEERRWFANPTDRPRVNTSHCLLVHKGSATCEGTYHHGAYASCRTVIAPTSSRFSSQGSHYTRRCACVCNIDSTESKQPSPRQQALSAHWCRMLTLWVSTRLAISGHPCGGTWQRCSACQATSNPHRGYHKRLHGTVPCFVL